MVHEPKEVGLLRCEIEALRGEVSRAGASLHEATSLYGQLAARNADLGADVEVLDATTIAELRKAVAAFYQRAGIEP